MDHTQFGGHFDLHGAIMNLPCDASKYDADPNQRLAMKEGHRDARHAAAELANSYVAHHESQDAKRLNAFINWFLREGSRAEISPNEHMKPATREDVMAWLDAQIEPIEGDAVTNMVEVLQNFCVEAKAANLANGQVYRTAQSLITTYMTSTFDHNPIPSLRRALGDFLAMAKMFRMPETQTIRKAEYWVTQ
jgi:hypothetical protein